MAPPVFNGRAACRVSLRHAVIAANAKRHGRGVVTAFVVVEEKAVGVMVVLFSSEKRGGGKV